MNGLKLIAHFDMYLIDTNILIWILRGEKWYISWFEKLKKDTELSISSISIAEIYKNIFPSEFLNTEQLINDFKIEDVTPTIAKQAGLYWRDYSRKIKKLHILDCIIASTARELNLTLITLNTRHFPMSDISVFDPVKRLR